MTKQSNYKPLVEFGLQLIHRKGLGLALPNRSTVIHHLKSRFEGAVEALERTKDGIDDSFEEYERDQKVKFGKDLIRELDPERSVCAPTYSIVLFAVENFETIGHLNCSCAYLSDVSEILAEVEKGDWGSRVTPPDTPAERAEWAQLLGDVTKGWGRP